MRVLLAAISVLLSASFAVASSPPPLPEALGAWSAVNETETFVGDELFLYINGGADIYHEYGFEQVTLRDYGRGEDRIAVEVYAMTGDAFGIFSILRSDQAQPLELCDRGSLGEYYARFQCGNQLVVVTAQTQSNEAQSEVLKASRKLASGFTAGGSPPQSLRMLPEEHRVPNTEAYVVGSLGMRKISPEAGRLFRGHAVSGRYAIPGGEEGRLLVFSFASEAAATDALDGAAKTAGEDSATIVKRSSHGLDVTFSGGTGLSAASRGRFVQVAVTAAGSAAARQLLALFNAGAAAEEGVTR
jgi:hypothetical protein